MGEGGKHRTWGRSTRNIRKPTLEEFRKGQLQDFTGQPSKGRMRRLETTSEKKKYNHLTLESGEREVLGGVKYEHPHCS